jgi:hypothetical protein
MPEDANRNPSSPSRAAAGSDDWIDKTLRGIFMLTGFALIFWFDWRLAVGINFILMARECRPNYIISIHFMHWLVHG